MRIEIKDASSKDFMFFKTFHHFRKIISLTGFNDSENPCKKDFCISSLSSELDENKHILIIELKEIILVKF